MTDYLRPDQMDPPALPDTPAQADANFQTGANAHDNRAALQRWFDALNSSYSSVVGLVNGSYGWRPGPNGEGLNLTMKPGVKLRGVTTEGAINQSALRMLPGGAAVAVAYDLTGARAVDIDGVQFNCDDMVVNPTIPQVGFLLAKPNSAAEGGRFTMRNSTISGPFTALLYTHGVEAVTFENCSLVVNGAAPASGQVIYAGTSNGYDVQSHWQPVYAGTIDQDLVLTIIGGFVQSYSTVDSYAMTLDGVQIVNIDHAALIASEAAIRITGPRQTKLLTISGGTKMVGNGAALRYGIRQMTPAIPEHIRLIGVRTDAREALYRQTDYPTEIRGLVIESTDASNSNMQAASLVGPYSGSQLKYSRIHCYSHGVSVGDTIDGTNRLYAPGTVSAPGGCAAGVVQA